MVFKFQRYTLIDIQIEAGFGGSSINIQDQPMLRNMRVTGIESYIVTDMPRSFITGNPVATLAQVLATSLNLYMGDPENESDTGEFVYRIPLIDLHNIQFNNTTNFVQRVLEFDEDKVQWEKCQLIFSQPLVPGATFSFTLGVYYTSRKDRLFKGLQKRLSGIGDGAVADVIMAKLMQLENWMKQLTSGKNNG